MMLHENANLHAPDRCIFLVTGIMASGKSTVAQLLAEKLNRGVHLRGDSFRRMIVSGREEYMPEPSQEAIRQLQLRYKIAASTADTFFEEGFNVVVQDVVIGPLLSEFVEMIRNRPLYVVVLTPNEKVIEEREASRSKTGYGAWTIPHLNQILQTETPKLGMWIDSSEQTPQETVDEIMRIAFSESALSLSKKKPESDKIPNSGNQIV
ncbi:AAA family ATPase [Brevibacillus sp. HB1.4B]|uniref:AAA family ATPase n=1 Tax=Brevibacillus sp. HB1.4B TaxID=2738845 RepID=UPI00156B1777|nr:AAA family ATPase [Brevibacillus sp. HB1.4B]NRS16233.1 AAA family ATPase [Brevibacillus sp. HB1.4B]